MVAFGFFYCTCILQLLGSSIDIYGVADKAYILIQSWKSEC